MTAEDPVEFNLVGINQVQVRESIGLNFAAALVSFSVRTPTSFSSAEIRDFETAEIAVKAALTGHLVLSTLHTNDAPSTINRLMKLGIEPLVPARSPDLRTTSRTSLCQNCKQPSPHAPAALLQAAFRPTTPIP